MVLRLERLPLNIPIADKNGRPQTAFSRWWDQALTQIEDNLNRVTAAQDAADGAQTDADAAMAAAVAAQAQADAALATAVAAQATANTAKATADALDAALDVAAGKVLTVLNTLTLSGIDGSTLNIGAGGTLGSAAFTNSSDYLPSGTSLAFLPINGGTLTGDLKFTDASFDIGKSGATRPRDAFLSRDLVVGGAITGVSLTGPTLALGTTGANPVIWKTNGSERAQITAAGFYKSDPNAGYNTARLEHTFRNGGTGWDVLALEHYSATSPVGTTVNFTATAPNNTSNYFARWIDTVGNKAIMQSNGGLHNFSANNVNLSDASMKTDIVPYNDNDLDALEASFVKVDWGRYKLIDQTHDDWNHGYTSQGVIAAFASTAPELVDETDLGPQDGAPKRLGVYDNDLTHIGMALLSRALKRLSAMETKMGLA